MEERVLGRTGRKIAVIGLGAWQLGADWGEVSDESAHATLLAAVDAGDRPLPDGDGIRRHLRGRRAGGRLWAWR